MCTGTHTSRLQIKAPHPSFSLITHILMTHECILQLQKQLEQRKSWWGQSACVARAHAKERTCGHHWGYATECVAVQSYCCNQLFATSCAWSIHTCIVFCYSVADLKRCSGQGTFHKGGPQLSERSLPMISPLTTQCFQSPLTTQCFQRDLERLFNDALHCKMRQQLLAA